MIERQSLIFSAEKTVKIQTEELSLSAETVLVKTLYSGISAGTELLIYRGQAPQQLAADETLAALAGDLSFPLKYGYACVGRVEAIGSAVDTSWQDRLVFAFNPHETHFVANPDQLIVVPEGISAETATLLPNIETAVSFVMDGQPIIGERAIIYGQGIVGLLTAMLLKSMPLAEVAAVDLSPQRIAASQSLGTTPPSSKSYDLAYELTGNPHALNDAIEAVGYGGRIVIGSWYGSKTAPLSLGGSFHRNHIQLISSQVSTLHPRWRGRWTKARRFDWACQMLAHHNPTHLITHRIPFTDAPSAYKLLDERPNEAIQVVLTYS